MLVEIQSEEVKASILLFEDEPSIAENLLYALETEGFTARRVGTAEEGLRLLAREKYDLVILDVGLPDMSGFEVCKRIRATSSIPVFFLTARSEEVDRIVGLEIGADDYIVKPFSPREVTARVKAMFRRLSTAVPAAAVAKAGPFSVDESRFRVLFNGADLGLSRQEYLLLKALVGSPGIVLSRTQLMEKSTDEPDMTLERTIDSHIKAIRAKIRAVDESRDWIETHRGFGYALATGDKD